MTTQLIQLPFPLFAAIAKWWLTTREALLDGLFASSACQPALARIARVLRWCGDIANTMDDYGAHQCLTCDFSTIAPRTRCMTCKTDPSTISFAEAKLRELDETAAS